MNFTGQTRRRVVNLGERKHNNQLNSKNYLERTKQQRQQREEQRWKDKCGTIIKQASIRYLRLRKDADVLYNRWINYKINSEEDFNSWCVDLYFLTNWKFPFDSIDLTIAAVDKLFDLLHQWQCTSIIPDILIKSLVRVIKFTRTPQLIHKIGLCLHLILTGSSVFNSDSTFQGFLDTLSSIIDMDKSLITKLILMVNTSDSYHAFLRFLANINWSLDPENLSLLRDLLSDERCMPESEVNRLSNVDKTYLLHNFLSMHKGSEFVLQDYNIIGNILSTISFSIYTLDDSEMLDTQNDDDDDDDYDKQKTSGPMKVKVPSDVIDSIESLYSNSFIQNMMQLCTGYNDDYSRLAVNVVSTLFYLLPSLKSKLCVSITIVPGSYKWFFKHLRENVIYKQLESLFGTPKDYYKPLDFQELYRGLDSLYINNFWKTLYTFEELYSYWLIVSNDLESFADDKLTLNEITNFLKFLKVLCLTLIFNSYVDNRWIYEEFEKLKTVSVSLLNQLHLKGLRLKFLDKNFWKINEISFNIDSMIQIVAEEEENQLQDDDSESEEPRSKYLRKVKVNNDTLAKLEILNKLPFFIDFNNRVQIFQSLVDLDRQRLGQGASSFFEFFTPPKIHGNIRRDHLLEDAYDNFGRLGSDFKNRISVSFFNKHGEQEAGIDGGGITKEFLNSVVEDGFNPSGKYKLFKETSDNQLYPSEEIFMKYYNSIDIEKQEMNLKYLKFLGFVIGKCLYEGVLIDVSFAPFFLNKWCNSRYMMKNSLNDLYSLDKELFNNLMKLTKMNEEELEALDLNFTTNQRVGNHNFKFDLVKNGELIKVNGSNRLNYIHQIANFKLNTSLHIQSKCFLEGLFEIISSNWLKMFDFNELQMLISGSEFNIDLEDWKHNVEYGGYLPDDLTIKYFWEVVEELDSKERSKLIKFVTSVSRAPLLGFGALNPKFGIRNSGRSATRLPTASTCVNLLKLPDYQDKKLLKDKLLYVIHTDAGFDLS